MPVVSFTGAEIDWLRRIAMTRLSAKQPRINLDTYDGGKTLLDMHFEAVKAEHAVCAAVPGARLDLSVSAGGQPRGNVILPDGRRANVKYRAERGRDYALKSRRFASFHGDIGVLVWPASVDGPAAAVQIVGAITRAQFMATAVEVELRDGTPRLLVPHGALAPIGHVLGTQPLVTQGSLF